MNITVWGKAEEKFISEYGLVTYRQWLQLEQNRMSRNCESVVVEQKGYIALKRVSK